MKAIFIFLLVGLFACSKKQESEIKLAPIKKRVPIVEPISRPVETETKESGSDENTPEIKPTLEKQIAVDLPLSKSEGQADEIVRKAELTKPGDIPDLPQMDGFKPREPLKIPDDKEYKGLGDM